MVIYNFIKYLILTIKYNSILKKVYKDENLIDGLKKVTGINFKTDNINRIYGVVNPLLIDINDQVFEYNQIGLDNSIFIERWLSSRLNLIQRFIKVNNLFDILTYKITKLDDYNNYLIVIQSIYMDDMFDNGKRLLKYIMWILIIGIILGVGWIFFGMR